MTGSSGSIGEAARFVAAVLSGSLAMGLAILALAGVGLAMLTGRLEVRRGLATILGCFLMVGAPAIARGILGFSAADVRPAVVTDVPTVTQPLEAKRVQQTADPYAGASLVR